MKHWSTIMATGVGVALLFGSLALGCGGGVKHPKPGEPNTEKYCANRPSNENNCMACSSQPGCGWCNSPKGGQAHCQPGTEHSSPATCEGGWALSTEDCDTPPPPPPPPAEYEQSEEASEEPTATEAAE